MKLTEEYLLNDFALVVAGGEVVEIDELLDIGLHIPDELELDIGLQESAGDFVEAFIQDFLVDDCGIAHLLESPRYAPAQL